VASNEKSLFEPLILTTGVIGWIVTVPAVAIRKMAGPGFTPGGMSTRALASA
jgi:hypothetical protein